MAKRNCSNFGKYWWFYVISLGSLLFLAIEYGAFYSFYLQYSVKQEEWHNTMRCTQCCTHAKYDCTEKCKNSLIKCSPTDNAETMQYWSYNQTYKAVKKLFQYNTEHDWTEKMVEKIGKTQDESKLLTNITHVDRPAARVLSMDGNPQQKWTCKSEDGEAFSKHHVSCDTDSGSIKIAMSGRYLINMQTTFVKTSRRRWTRKTSDQLHHKVTKSVPGSDVILIKNTKYAENEDKISVFSSTVHNMMKGSYLKFDFTSSDRYKLSNKEYETFFDVVFLN